MGTCTCGGMRLRVDIFGMNRWLLAVLVLMSGCTPRDYFRTSIGTTPCRVESGADCASASLLLDEKDGYALGFVEFDDNGRFYDPRQADALISWLSDRRQPQYVAVYAHGWHHNANDADNNVRRFKESLRDIKRRNPQYRVVGVYLGWRGETLDLPWLRALTFWGRKAVSETLGRHQLLDFLLRVETVVKHDAGQGNRLLTIGHSLGALVIFNALQPVWLQRLSQSDGEHAGFGDLVVLVNPAFEARRFAALRATVQQSGAINRFPGSQNPLLVIASSEVDGITKTAFTWTRAVPALFENAPDMTAAAGLQEVSEWDLGITAVGHFQSFITHRLEATNPLTAADESCPVGSEADVSGLADPRLVAGPAWTVGGDSVWRFASGMQLRHLADKPANDPVWVIQTDKYILPNHGFMNQKPFWCFVERMVEAVNRPATG
ncbi:MAG: hypothetical protein ACXV7F_06845 [Methylomonas sp.]